MDLLPAQIETENLHVGFQDEVEQAKVFYTERHAPATRQAYASDWAIFEKWCCSRDIRTLPVTPAAVATFLSSQAAEGMKASTLSRRVAAIRYFHALAGIMDPPTSSEVVRATMKGIRRTIGVAKEHKAPATSERILKMVAQTPETCQGLRDRAILLLGFAGAFRRSELAALQFEDLEEVSEGLRVHICKSKTDQEGEGCVVPIVRGTEACPVAAVKAWLKAGGIQNGPIFRRMGKGGRIFEQALTPHSIGKVVKKYAEKAGFNPDMFGGHSLRAGFLTSAAMKGASIFRMMDISRHKSVDTLRGYVRQAEEFKDHAGQGLL